MSEPLDLEAILKRASVIFPAGEDKPSHRVIVQLADWESLLSEVTRLQTALEEKTKQYNAAVMDCAEEQTRMTLARNYHRQDLDSWEAQAKGWDEWRAAAQQREDNAEGLLAGISDCLNQELRENGLVDVSQTTGYLADMRPFIRLLVDLVRKRSTQAAQQREAGLVKVASEFFYKWRTGQIYTDKDVDALEGALTAARPEVKK